MISFPFPGGSGLGTGAGDVQDDCEKCQHRFPLCLFPLSFPGILIQDFTTLLLAHS